MSPSAEHVSESAARADAAIYEACADFERAAREARTVWDALRLHRLLELAIDRLQTAEQQIMRRATALLEE